MKLLPFKPGLAENVLATLIAAVLLFFGGYYLGKSDEREDQALREKKAQEAAIATHNHKADAGQQAEQHSAQREKATSGIFNGITHQVIDYAQTHATDPVCLLGDDGLRLWNAANAGADAADTCAGVAALPAAAAGTERADDGAAGEPHRRGQDVSRVPRSAPGADRLAGGH